MESRYVKIENYNVLALQDYLYYFYIVVALHCVYGLVERSLFDMVKASLRAGSLDRQGRWSRNREPVKPARRMGRGKVIAIAAPPPLPIK